VQTLERLAPDRLGAGAGQVAQRLMSVLDRLRGKR
jgi:hypothetical protein